jgi:rubrerythrin
VNRDAEIHSLPEFLAHALAIEREAAARYQELADQMAVHNNTTVAELFQWLARIEAEHAEQVARHAQGASLPAIKPWDYRWIGFESPESAAHEGVHYLMTPFQALELALANEQRAAQFFERVAGSTRDASVLTLAREMAADERQHVVYVERAMAKHARPQAGWAEDLDPAHEPE